MEPIVSLDQLDPDKLYTYADYLTWQFQDRVELIKGRIMKMAAPAPKHQQTLNRINLQLLLNFENKNCEVCLSPFDVRLPKAKGNKAYTVVQPDLFVVCNPELIDDKGCDGVPDLIIEILSPSNAHTDLRIKHELYEEVGVKEYWIVFPKEELIEQFVWQENGLYSRPNVFTAEQKINSALFPDLEVDLSKVFAQTQK